jgi:hypothetical protein
LGVVIFGWRSENYFDQPLKIELCKSIEANDLVEIDRLVAAGADVNAQGKGKMTPLLWAFPDGNLERFTHLLKLGADPNTLFEGDFNTRGALQPAQSVTHLAAGTAFPGCFDAAFNHHGWSVGQSSMANRFRKRSKIGRAGNRGQCLPAQFAVEWTPKLRPARQMPFPEGRRDCAMNEWHFLTRRSKRS